MKAQIIKKLDEILENQKLIMEHFKIENPKISAQATKKRFPVRFGKKLPSRNGY